MSGTGIILFGNQKQYNPQIGRVAELYFLKYEVLSLLKMLMTPKILFHHFKTWGAILQLVHL